MKVTIMLMENIEKLIVPFYYLIFMFSISNNADDFKWALVVVYGPAQAEQKEHFLAELVHMCSHENLPLLMGGDYNILRHPSEKKQ
jgi:hypothetical protein